MRLSSFSLCLLLISAALGCAAPARKFEPMEICQPGTPPGSFSCLNVEGNPITLQSGDGLICFPVLEFKNYDETCKK